MATGISSILLGLRMYVKSYEFSSRINIRVGSNAVHFQLLKEMTRRSTAARLIPRLRKENAEKRGSRRYNNNNFSRVLQAPVEDPSGDQEGVEVAICRKPRTTRVLLETISGSRLHLKMM